MSWHSDPVPTRKRSPSTRTESPLPSPEPIVTHMGAGWCQELLTGAAGVSEASAGGVSGPPSEGASGGGSFAHSSSKSTRHLPSSFCSSLSFARKVRPERPLNPGTGFKVRPDPGSAPPVRDCLSDSISSFTTDGGRFLPAFFFQITKPQPGSSFDQHE